MKKIIIGIILFISFSIKNYAQINDVKLYTFGHSLIDHRPPAIATPSDETTILHWMYDIAQEAGHSFAAGGQYGFLTNHDDLPPHSNWGYDIVPSVWDETEKPFSDSDINTILLTAANFIQYIPPNQAHPLDNTTTVVESTETIFDWVHQEKSDAKFYIYINWPEMDLPNAYPPTPPSQTVINDFHNLTIESFTSWWTEYQDELLSSRPQLNTRLIPVGPIISKILSDLIPNQIPFTELYEDSAPHGRATLYFLAGMITYMAIYEENIPTSYIPDNIVHQTVRENITTISNFVWNELHSFNLPSGESRVFNSLTTTDLTNIEATTINIFPNPIQEVFSITGISKNYTIEIIDVQGKIYQTYNNNSPSIIVDINNVPNGLYFIRVRNQRNNILYLKRIIKG